MSISSFVALHSIIHPRPISEFLYRYSGPAPAPARIFMSFILDSAPPIGRESEIRDVLVKLFKQGMNGKDISGNELAKSHARYMAGGRYNVEHERVFRFGALLYLLYLLRQGKS